MTAASLPPIGAKIRTTTCHDGGATVVIEGIVTAHPTGRVAEDPWVIVGDGEGVTAYVQDWPGAKVTVEVLELAEPDDGTVYRCTRPIGAQNGAEQSWLLWRHDGWEANGDGRRWFKSFTGGEQAYAWADVQPQEHERRAELVPDAGQR